MRVLNYSHGADTGGVGHLLKAAFDRHSDIEYRQACRTLNYIGYPRDLPVQKVRVSDFDVVHANIRIGDLPRMPTVVHYHGTPFRRDPKTRLKEQRRRGAVGVVSTLDLWLKSPKYLEWLPTPYNLDWLASMRTRVDDGVYRIAHAPTQRGIKSTGAFLAAVDRLAREMPVETILIEKTPWTACLRTKARADVYYDQVTLGYGNNAIEAWGMGIPVVAGAQPDTLTEMGNRFGVLPFYEATEDTIYEALRDLADPAVRADYTRRGRRHVERWHADDRVVAMLEPIYRRLGGDD